MSEKDRGIGEKRADVYYAKYTEGPGDKAFMEKTDWEYIQELDAAGQLLETEPNADKEIARDHAYRREIEEALQRARQAATEREKQTLALEAKRKEEEERQAAEKKNRQEAAQKAKEDRERQEKATREKEVRERQEKTEREQRERKAAEEAKPQVEEAATKQKEQKQWEKTLETKTQEAITSESTTRWNPAVFVQTVEEVSALKRVITSSEIHQSISTSRDDLVRVTEQALIMQNPVFDEYYHYFLLLFKGLLSAASVVHTRLVACESTKLQKGIGIVGKGLEVALEGLDKIGKHIPLASMGTKILVDCLKLYEEPHKKKFINALASFLHSAEEVSKFTECLARQLTISKRKDLDALVKPKDPACTFGQQVREFFQSAKASAVTMFDTLKTNDINTPIRKLAEADCEKIVKAIGGNPETYSKLKFSDMGCIFEIVMGEGKSYTSPVTENDICQIQEPGKFPVVTGSVYAMLSGKTAPLPPQKQDSTKAMLAQLLATQAETAAQVQAMQQERAQDAQKIARLESQLASQKQHHEDTLTSLRQENQALREMINTDHLEEQIATLKQQLEAQGEKADQSTAETLRAELKKVNVLSETIADKQRHLDAAQQDQARKISQIPTDFLAGRSETMLTSQDFAENNKKLQAFKFNITEMRAMLETLLGKTLEHGERLDKTEMVVESMGARGKSHR